MHSADAGGFATVSCVPYGDSFINVFKSVLSANVVFAAFRAISYKLKAEHDRRCVPVKWPIELYNRQPQLEEQTSSATVHSETDVTCVRPGLVRSSAISLKLHPLSIQYVPWFCFCSRVLFYFAPTRRSHRTPVRAFLYPHPDGRQKMPHEVWMLKVFQIFIDFLIFIY